MCLQGNCLTLLELCMLGNSAFFMSSAVVFFYFFVCFFQINFNKSAGPDQASRL